MPIVRTVKYCRLDCGGGFERQVMPKSRSFVFDFAVKVFLPSLVAAISISLLLLHIFDGIVKESNALDDAYAQRSANSALMSLRESMESLVRDNAAWDDAVSNIYGKLNAEWLSANWGISDEPGLYDASFVVDAEGRTLFASFSGDAGNAGKNSIEDYLGPTIGEILASLPKTGENIAVTSSIVKSAKGISVFGAGVIVPYSDEMPAPTGNLARLILVKTIDNKVLAKLSRQFVLDKLQFGNVTGSNAASMVINSPDGSQLATLVWSKRNPGTALRVKFGDVVSTALMLFLLVVGVLVYISWRGFKQAHESKAEAIAASLRDELTGLANRRELVNVLAAACANRDKISVVYADLDGFKEVNDAYGHGIGDLVLKSAAAGFSYLAGTDHLVARLGGDEFAIIVSGDTCKDQSRQLARNMIIFLGEPMHFGGRVASVSVSVGIVDLEAEETGSEEIIRRADVAMYAAKAAGRNRFHVYDPSLDAKRDENRAIARDLREAIDLKQLGVVYQPIVGARTRRTMGVEALVRWPQNSRRHYPPDVFVPVAEEFGLIEDLGNFVLAEACKQAVNWPNIFVSVNVSAIQFMNPAFADIVESTLRKTGLEASRLEIEVTESFVIDNAERATIIIGKLHEMRVSVALDDFGTGHSSIGHLRRFKFDKLKIDRSMVEDVLRKPSALRLVQGTVAMADALGLCVTAEGVDNENQVAMLRMAGCSLFQGYLFSKPVEAKYIPAFLTSRAVATAV